ELAEVIRHESPMRTAKRWRLLPSDAGAALGTRFAIVDQPESSTARSSNRSRGADSVHARHESRRSTYHLAHDGACCHVLDRSPKLIACARHGRSDSSGAPHAQSV